NQAPGPGHLVHNGVAGVDTRRAVHAFHLSAVADIDPGGADPDALAAIDAIAKAFAPAGFRFLAALPVRALLPALLGVSDHQGVLIQNCGLESAVRTDKRAGLLAESGEYRIEHQGEQDHESQAGDMVRRVVCADLNQLLATDDVAQKRIPDDEG